MNDEGLRTIIELRFRLLKQMENISTQVDNILEDKDLNIHQMADLLRYAQTFECLSGSYSNLNQR